MVPTQGRLVQVGLIMLILLTGCARLRPAAAPAATALAATAVVAPTQAAPPVVAAATPVKPPVPAAASTPSQTAATATSRPSGPNPLNVTARLDSTRATSETLAENGGTLTATAADGTRFTLEIPADALADETTITITPVSALDGLRLSGKSLATLHVEPEGLTLFKPATLLIEPGTPIPLREQISFAYQGTGKDLHLFPLTGDTHVIKFQLSHFSGYGVGQGSAADLQLIKQNTPSSAQAQAEAEIGGVLQDARTRDGYVNDSDVEQIRKSLDKWFNTGVSGHLKGAESDAAQFDTAAHEFLSWLRMIQLLGLDGKFEKQTEAGLQSLAKGLATAYAKAKEKCNIPEMLVRGRQAALLGLEQYQPTLLTEKVLSDAVKCMAFDLEVGGKATNASGRTSLVVPKQRVQMLRVDDATFRGIADLRATWEPIPPELLECVVTDPKLILSVNATATREDNTVVKDSPLGFIILLSMRWSFTSTCPGVAGLKDRSTSLGQPLEFTLHYRDGDSYEWKSIGFPNGGITFTVRTR